MIQEETYIVHTHWGWFRLDGGAYRDYLAGKLWITWVPGKRNVLPETGHEEYSLPPDITEAAIRLRDLATRTSMSAVFQSTFPNAKLPIPYKQRMRDKSIDELALSVRSSNGLMRANAGTFGRLWEVLSQENGLRAVRNLGAKSEAEISVAFCAACYNNLSPSEKATFWQEAINGVGAAQLSVQTDTFLRPTSHSVDHSVE